MEPGWGSSHAAQPPRGSRLDGAQRPQYHTLGPGGVLLLPVGRRQALGAAAPRDEGEELGSRLPIDVQVPDRPLLAQHDMAAGQQVPGGRQGCTWGPPVGDTRAGEWVVAGDTGPHQTPVLSAAGQTMRLPQIHEHSRERHPRPGPREAGAGQQQVGSPAPASQGRLPEHQLEHDILAVEAEQRPEEAQGHHAELGTGRR